MKHEMPHFVDYSSHMGVSIDGGTPKWMVYNGKSTKIDDLEVTPFQETSTYMMYNMNVCVDVEST